MNTALQHEPIEFAVVGPVMIRIPEDLQNSQRVRWRGSIPRGEVARYYREADVFIFPTHSDGFGLTQLEAQAWKLPVIATPYCGDVVEDGVNGRRLKEASASAIVAALREIVQCPYLLTQWSKNSGIGEQFSIDSLANALEVLF